MSLIYINIQFKFFYLLLFQFIMKLVCKYDKNQTKRINKMEISNFVPKPLVDAISPTLPTKYALISKLAEADMFTDVDSYLKSGIQKFAIKSLALAALGAGAALYFGVQPGAALLFTGSIVSLPATMIAGGTYLLVQSSLLLKAGLMANTLGAVVLGLGGALGGFLTVNAYDKLPLGLLAW